MAEKHFQSLLERNGEVQQQYRKPWMLKDIAHGKDPRKRVMIITCADARADPAFMFKLKPAEVSTIRVAGGRVGSQVIQSLEIMGTLADFGLIVVIHHTDCGGLFTTDSEVKERLTNRYLEHKYLARSRQYPTFGHIGLDESIREDVGLLRDWQFLPRDCRVVGYAYDVETGALREVDDELAKL